MQTDKLVYAPLQSVPALLFELPGQPGTEDTGDRVYARFTWNSWGYVRLDAGVRHLGLSVLRLFVEPA